MAYEATKLELIEWLTHLDDDATLTYLKLIKDSRSRNLDWWDELSDEQSKGIERGLRDIREGSVTSHEQVRKKYGL